MVKRHGPSVRRSRKPKEPEWLKFMSTEEQEKFVEQFELKEGQGLINLLSQVALNYQNRLYGIDSNLYMDEEQLVDLGNIIRRIEEGFLQQAQQYQKRTEGYYAPMSRYGTYFISVKDNEDRLIWYEQMESAAPFGVGTERMARERYNELVLEYPDATVSKPEEITIEELRSVYRGTKVELQVWSHIAKLIELNE